MEQKELSHERKFKAPVIIATGTLPLGNNIPVVDGEHEKNEEDSFYSSQSRYGSSANNSEVEVSASNKRENFITILTTDGQTIPFEQPYYYDSNWKCPHCDHSFGTEHEIMVHSLSCKHNLASPLAPKVKKRSEMQHPQEGVEVQTIEVKNKMNNGKSDKETEDQGGNMFSFQPDDIRKSLKNSSSKQRKVGILKRLFLPCFSRKYKRKNTADTAETADLSPLSLSPVSDQSRTFTVSNQHNHNDQSESGSYPIEEMSLTCSSFTTNSSGESMWFRDNGSYEMRLLPTILGRKNAHLQNTATVPTASIFDGMTFEPFISIVGEME